MTRYLLQFVPYYFGWIICRTLLGWIGLCGLVMALMLFLGYTFETLILLLEWIGQTGAAQAIAAYANDISSFMGFDSFSSFFAVAATPTLGLLGFIFSFVMSYLVQSPSKTIQLAWTLAAIMILNVIMLKMLDRPDELPLMDLVGIRLIGGVLCVLGFYVIEVAHHSLQWTLFMLHVIFLKRDH